MGLTGRSARKKRKARARRAKQQAAEEAKYQAKADSITRRLSGSFDNPRVNPNAYADLQGNTFGGAEAGGKAAPNADGVISHSTANPIDAATGQAVGKPPPPPKATPAFDFSNFQLPKLDFSNLGNFTLGALNDGTTKVKRKKIYGMYQGGNVPGYKGGTMNAGGK